LHVEIVKLCCPAGGNDARPDVHAEEVSTTGIFEDAGLAHDVEKPEEKGDDK
jgi:hypothetical protein